MTTRRTLGIVAAFALAAIVAGISVLTAGASSEQSFTLLVRYDKSSFETDDVAPKGNSVGDQFFLTGALTRDGTVSWLICNKGQVPVVAAVAVLHALEPGRLTTERRPSKERGCRTGARVTSET